MNSRSSQKIALKYRELRFTVVCSICHQIWEFQAVVLQRTARNCSKVRAARARLFVLTQPIKFLLSGVVIAVLLLMRKLNFNISATSVHVLWVIDFMQSALWLHGVITRAIHLMRNTKGSFTCDWDFSAFQPTTWLHNFGKPGTRGWWFSHYIKGVGLLVILLFNHASILRCYQVVVPTRFFIQFNSSWVEVWFMPFLSAVGSFSWLFVTKEKKK